MMERRSGALSWESNAIAASAAAAALLCFAAAGLFPSPVQAQGLKLEQAKEKVVDAYDNPNPHMELECTECHDEDFRYPDKSPGKPAGGL